MVNCLRLPGSCMPTKDQQGNGTLIYLLREKAGDTLAKYIRQFEYY